MSIQTIRVVFAGTFPNASTRHIDLGMVSVRDAAIYGRTRPLIPYAEGRLISSVRFVAPATGGFNGSLWAMTPNTVGIAGYAVVISNDFSDAKDTLGLVSTSEGTGLDGGLNGGSNTSQILDCGPLIAGTSNPVKEFDPVGTWQANTPYCINDSILDSNDNIQTIGINGVSGGTEPTWSTMGTTNDGTAQWNFQGAIDTGEVHMVAEVIEGISPMPPYPATLEFVQQPTNAVHNVTISPAITVKILDQNGDPFVFAGVTIALFIYGAGTLAGTTSKTQNLTTGIATFNNLSISEIHNGYILRAELYPTVVTDAIYSNTFNIT